MFLHKLVRVALILSIAFGIAAKAAEFPSHFQDSLEGADDFELLSLNPSRSTPHVSDRFHGWVVLGRTSVKDANVRKVLIAAFMNGVEENPGGYRAQCFNPRHGIRVTRGSSTVDFVICFECLRVEAYLDKEGQESLPIWRSPEPVFDNVLRFAGIPLARGQ